MASWKRPRRYLEDGLFGGGGTITAPPGSTFATWDPAFLPTGMTLSNGNLTATRSSGTVGHTRSTIPVYDEGNLIRRKAYFELTIGAGFVASGLDSGVGATNNEALVAQGLGGSNGASGMHYNATNGHTLAFFWDFAYGSSFVAGNVIGIAMDWSDPPINGGNAMAFSVGGTWGNGDNPSGRILTAYDTNRVITHSVYGGIVMDNTVGNSITANFGATPFTYPVPSGFRPGLYT